MYICDNTIYQFTWQITTKIINLHSGSLHLSGIYTQQALLVNMMYIHIELKVTYDFHSSVVTFCRASNYMGDFLLDSF